MIETASHTTYLIDGGSTDEQKVGTYRIQPFLLYQGIDTINYAVITHSDTDHISGLLELLEGNKIEIEHLLLPHIKEKDPSYLELEQVAKMHGVTLLYIEAGDVFMDGEVCFTCLHPSPEYPYTTVNDYSTVLSLSYKEFDMLLTGDLEKAGEEEVLEVIQRFDHPYDVLKVSHHGSKNATTKQWLQSIQPKISLISCGKNNSYGHPHEEVLERLKQVRSDVFITFDSGAITIKTDGKNMKISEYRKEE